MERNRKEIEEMSKSWEQKMAEANAEKEAEERKKKEEAEARASGRPQLLNLNQDGILDRKIFIDLSKETNASVGRKQRDQSQNPRLVLGGIGIQSEHATFETKGGETYLVPKNEEAFKQTCINGKFMTSMKPVKLMANDRVVFG